LGTLVHMEAQTDTKTLLIRVPEWAHRAIRVAAAHRGTTIQDTVSPVLMDLATSLGGSPVTGAYPSLAQPDEPTTGPGVPQETAME
jgi:hypothetical protein